MTRNRIITLERMDDTKQWQPVMRMHAAVNKAKGAETLDGGETVEYAVEFAEVGGETVPVKLTDGAGHSAVITWEEAGA